MLSRTRIVGDPRLEKYVFPFFYRTVVMNDVLVGAPNRY